MPASVNLGGHAAYVGRLRGLLQGCDAAAAMASSQFLRFLREAADGMGLAFTGTPAAFDELPEHDVELEPSGPAETAYLQYTSGSTSFPRGVVITQHAVLSNLAGVVNHGLDIKPDDRCVSWLPFYHDMGLVGCMLAPMATQRSIDYLDTRDFAMRPRRWLELMTNTRATISFSPPFGYELCARRIRPEDVASYDLSAWRDRGHRRRAHPGGAAGSVREAPGAGRVRSGRVRALLRHGRELARDQLLAAQAAVWSSTGSTPITWRNICA